MKSKARFEKVSFEQFKTDVVKNFPEYADNEEYIKGVYDGIKIPKRGTYISAGYDFFLPEGIYVPSGKAVLVPTGIRCVNMREDEVLMVFPRSGLGTKKRFCPANLTGIVDADYSTSDNEGHIFMKMVNDGNDVVDLDRGTAFCQGILLNYNITLDDDMNETHKRNGGFGSTDKKTE